MTLVDPAKIRNLAVVGHRGSGKTSLVEALLFTTGAKNRLGAVMDGTTAMDHDEDEIKRQMTISAGLAHADWAGHRINLLDTPGEASFINEALGTLPVVEGVLMLVNAVTKVEVQTERLWKRARDMGVSRVAAVNMMDRERADFADALAALKARFGDEVVAVALPIGQEAGFRGVVDLVAMKAYTYSGTSGRAVEGPIPDDLADAAAKARESLVDRVAEADDAALGEVPRGWRIVAARSERGTEGRGGRRYGSAGHPGGGDQEHRLRPSARDLAHHPLARRARSAEGRQGAGGRRDGAAVRQVGSHRSLRVQDYLRPVLRPREPCPDLLRQDRDRYPVAERAHRRERAHREHPAHAGQGDQDRRGGWGRGHRGPRQTEGDRHGRHAVGS